MKIIDTHTHLYFPDFDKDRDQVIQKDREAGVKAQVQIGCDEISSLAALSLAKAHDDFYCTLGIHPTEVHNLGRKEPRYKFQGFENTKNKALNLDQLFQLFEELFQKNQKKVVGFGETGFDFYHIKKTPETHKAQKQAFKKHLEFCTNFERTLVIHCRNAAKETLDFLEENKKEITSKNFRGVIHCFCEDKEFAEIATQKYNFFLGLGGILTYPKAENVRQAIKDIPIKHLVTETDAPFLVPEGWKADFTRNQSGFLTEVILKISEIKQTDLNETTEALFENGKRLFNL